ncbi:hypothetical protein B0J13DRAFT_12909 [Dactylonectria estremocensis]|uniref:Uncharacterized protein n=1 Tax=Dactylonectria estremocensis TaxID=1079267 RepID=A0A9P9FKB9_9HYPO|nr:hypothetical protein B0J13DRAFT_12909 [Dactylonectria estremocensis]
MFQGLPSLDRAHSTRCVCFLLSKDEEQQETTNHHRQTKLRWIDKASETTFAQLAWSQTHRHTDTDTGTQAQTRKHTNTLTITEKADEGRTEANQGRVRPSSRSFHLTLKVSVASSSVRDRPYPCHDAATAATAAAGATSQAKKRREDGWRHRALSQGNQTPTMAGAEPGFKCHPRPWMMMLVSRAPCSLSCSSSIAYCGCRDSGCRTPLRLFPPCSSRSDHSFSPSTSRSIPLHLPQSG